MFIKLWFNAELCESDYENGQKLCGTGFNIDNKWIGSLLIAGLHDKFSPMIMAIEHWGITITMDSIKNKLLDMECIIGKAVVMCLLVNLQQIGCNWIALAVILCVVLRKIFNVISLKNGTFQK